MSKQIKNGSVHTDFLDAFDDARSFEVIFEVVLDAEAVEQLINDCCGLIYIKAKSKHRARLALAEHIVARITKMSDERMRELVGEELAEQAEHDKAFHTKI